MVPIFKKYVLYIDTQEMEKHKHSYKTIAVECEI